VQEMYEKLSNIKEMVKEKYMHSAIRTMLSHPTGKNSLDLVHLSYELAHDKLEAEKRQKKGKKIVTTEMFASIVKQTIGNLILFMRHSMSMSHT